MTTYDYPIIAVSVENGEVGLIMNDAFLERNKDYTPESVKAALESTGLVVRYGLTNPLDSEDQMLNGLTVTGESFLQNLYAPKGVMQLLGDTLISKSLLTHAEEQLVLAQIDEVKLKQQVTTGIAWAERQMVGMQVLAEMSNVVKWAGIVGTVGGAIASPFLGNIIVPVCGMIATIAGALGAKNLDKAAESAGDRLDTLREESTKLDDTISEKLRSHLEERRKGFEL